MIHGSLRRSPLSPLSEQPSSACRLVFSSVSPFFHHMLTLLVCAVYRAVSHLPRPYPALKLLERTTLIIVDADTHSSFSRFPVSALYSSTNGTLNTSRRSYGCVSASIVVRCSFRAGRKKVRLVSSYSPLPPVLSFPPTLSTHFDSLMLTSPLHYTVWQLIVLQGVRLPTSFLLASYLP
jgi:hypothetical protein